MRVTNYRPAKSSFLSMEKDLSTITNLILENKRIQKLLYYTTPDAMYKKDVPEDKVYELIGKNIKIIPKLYIDEDVLNYLFISFDNYTPNDTNPEFRDSLIFFDIICHYDQWQLKDFQLRPYRIAAELDATIDKKHLSGIGEIEFMGASQILMSDEFAGLTLMYRTVHGGEDRKNMLNPLDQAQLEEEFDELPHLD